MNKEAEIDHYVRKLEKNSYVELPMEYLNDVLLRCYFSRFEVGFIWGEWSSDTVETSRVYIRNI